MSTERITHIKEEISKLGIEIADVQAEQFVTYYEMLVETNKVMNLTAITEFEDVLCKHFVDSLSIVRKMNLKNIHNMVDIGTGAGFPGVPIKIVYPHIHLALVDSLGKRVKFLNSVVDNLNLADVECVHSRTEDLARNKSYREKFDLCTARAVASLNVLSEYCLPYVRVGGTFAAFKSGNVDNEIEGSENAIKILGGKIENTDVFDLYDFKRSIVQIKKIKKTPMQYPRKAGTPSKNPL
jgi:16S rRNA (guanine527-N7)-methyltransferase